MDLSEFTGFTKIAGLPTGDNRTMNDMWEVLAVRLKIATHVKIVSWIDQYTRELVHTIERYNDVLWWRRDSEIIFVVDQDANRKMEYIKHEVYKQGNEIVSDILSRVNWDEFWEKSNE